MTLSRFLYSDEVQIGPETVMTTLYTAKKYAVPALEAHCVEFLKKNLRADNAFMLLTQVRQDYHMKRILNVHVKVNICACIAQFMLLHVGGGEKKHLLGSFCNPIHFFENVTCALFHALLLSHLPDSWTPNYFLGNLASSSN